MSEHDVAPEVAIKFLGAAGTVTGSMHLLEVGDKRLLIDCGMYQGRRAEARARNSELPAEARRADAMILTHAHIDHSGMIPRLVRLGFSGEIYCTKATWDLCRYMLADSARIQVYDAKWLNKKFADDPDFEPVEPLYEPADVDRALKLFAPKRYQLPFSPLPGVTARLLDAGHILGSSSVDLEIAGAGVAGKPLKLAFSGDIGRRGLPILRDPVPPRGIDYAVMETTYGNRSHAAVGGMGEQLRDAIETARKRGGKVLIPSFALERTQEIVFALNRLFTSGALAPLPVYVDSPLAVDVTSVFRRHAECYDEETSDFDRESGDPFGFARLTMIESVEESKGLNDVKESCVIISASGMCEFGRIVHHLRNSIEDRRNMILIVGYQAQHTLGRRLVEGRSEVKIFGVARSVQAEVRVLDAFSAHADRDELAWWAEACGESVRRFFLVHGDPDQSEAFGDRLVAAGRQVHIPTRGERVRLSPPSDGALV